jgi:hypothetical protein
VTAFEQSFDATRGARSEQTFEFSGGPHSERLFDHAEYVKSRLPYFVLVGMGLRPPRPRPPDPDFARPQVPRRVQRRLETPSEPPDRAAPPLTGSEHVQKSVSGPEAAPDGPRAVRRFESRADRHDRWAKNTVSGVLAAPLFIIALLVFLALLLGPFGNDQVVVNDPGGPGDGCSSGPMTIDVDELASRPYWEEC